MAVEYPKFPGGSDRRRVRTFVIIAVVIGLAVSLGMSALSDRAQLAKALHGVSIIIVVVPLALCVATHVVDALRLMLVLSQFGIRVSFSHAFYNSCAGSFFSSITPMTAGGQPFQIYHLSSVGVPLETSANVIGSRLVGSAITSVLISFLFVTQVPSMAATLGVGVPVLWTALVISLAGTVVLALLLLCPHVVARWALVLERTALGRLISRISRRSDWASGLLDLAQRLRDSVRRLWARKTWVMVIDAILGLLNTALHAYALQFVLEGIGGVHLSFLTVLVTFVILWQLVVYLPTPGASGGVEGAFALVFAGMTGSLPLTVIGVSAWRFSSYYLLLLVDGLIYAAMRRVGGTRIRVTMEAAE